MGSATDTRYSIIPEGDLKEEVREWSDIEALARAGRLSPNTLIFMPAENAWKKLCETALAGCFEKAPLAGCFERTARAGTAGEGVSAEAPGSPVEDESLLEAIRANPNDVALLLKAADAAVAARKTDAAHRYFQRALEASPYHPRIAQEAKRKLPASKWKTLKFLEKPAQAWEDPVALLAFPLSRGPVYIAVPALVLAALFLTPWTSGIALLAAALWAMETARAVSRGETRAPLRQALLADPFGRIVKPAAATVIVAAELSVLFVAAAGVLVATKSSAERDLLAVIAKSPVMTVLLVTLLLSYFPAAVVLFAGPRRGLAGVWNPKRVVSAVRVMEGEYLVSVAAVAVVLCAVWGIGALSGLVPFLDRVVYGTGTAYVALFGGFVLGRLYARFRDRIDPEAGEAVTDAADSVSGAE